MYKGFEFISTVMVEHLQAAFLCSHGIIIKYRYLTSEKVWAIFTVNLELCIRAMIMLSYKMCFEPDLVM